MHAVAHRERTRVSSYRPYGMRAGIRYDGWRRNALDSRGLSSVPLSRPRRLRLRGRTLNSRITGSWFQDYGNSRIPWHRYRDYMARDKTIKVIPNRRSAWLELRHVRDLNTSKDYGLFFFWTLAGEVFTNALRAPLRRLQIDPDWIKLHARLNEYRDLNLRGIYHLLW